MSVDTDLDIVWLKELLSGFHCKITVIPFSVLYIFGKEIFLIHDPFGGEKITSLREEHLHELSEVSFLLRICLSSVIYLFNYSFS